MRGADPPCDGAGLNERAGGLKDGRTPPPEGGWKLGAGDGRKLGAGDEGGRYPGAGAAFPRQGIALPPGACPRHGAAGAGVAGPCHEPLPVPGTAAPRIVWGVGAGEGAATPRSGGAAVGGRAPVQPRVPGGRHVGAGTARIGGATCQPPR